MPTLGWVVNLPFQLLSESEWSELLTLFTLSA